MDCFDNEVHSILLRRLGVRGKSIGWWDQVARARWLRLSVGANILGSRSKQLHFVKVRLVIVQKWILRADINLDSVFNTQPFDGFEAIRYLLISPMIA